MLLFSDEYLKELTVRPAILEKPNLLNTPTFNVGILVNRLRNINDIKESELTHILKDSYPTIIKKSVTEKFYRDLFMDSKFVYCFGRMLHDITLSEDMLYDLNKLFYDYIHFPNADPIILQRLSKLAVIVNKQPMMILNTINNMNEDLACSISIARYSTMENTIAIRRINNIIRGLDPNIISLQFINDIYEKFFNKVTPLFEAYIFDGVALYNNNQMIMDNKIMISVLNILENIPSVEINKVLISYRDRIVVEQLQPKININSINPVQFERILKCIEDLKSQDIYIP